MKKTLLLMILSMPLLGGCLATPKYNGVTEILEGHQQGAIDARDASPEAKAFLRELMQYINQLEFELERPQ